MVLKQGEGLFYPHGLIQGAEGLRAGDVSLETTVPREILTHLREPLKN